MLTQVDADRHSLTMMEGICGHRTDPDKAIEKADGYVYTRSGQKRQRKTTQGWDLLIIFRKNKKIKKHTQIWIQDIPSSTSPTWSSRSDAEKEVCFNWKTKD